MTVTSWYPGTDAIRLARAALKSCPRRTALTLAATSGGSLSRSMYRRRSAPKWFTKTPSLRGIRVATQGDLMARIRKSGMAEIREQM